MRLRKHPERKSQEGRLFVNKVFVMIVFAAGFPEYGEGKE
jgi:hypothetical protein